MKWALRYRKNQTNKPSKRTVKDISLKLQKVLPGLSPLFFGVWQIAITPH